MRPLVTAAKRYLLFSLLLHCLSNDDWSIIYWIDHMNKLRASSIALDWCAFYVTLLMILWHRCAWVWSIVERDISWIIANIMVRLEKQSYFLMLSCIMNRPWFLTRVGWGAIGKLAFIFPFIGSDSDIWVFRHLVFWKVALLID